MHRIRVQLTGDRLHLTVPLGDRAAAVIYMPAQLDEGKWRALTDALEQIKPAILDRNPDAIAELFCREIDGLTGEL